uniref:Uncharacterized protein n=1 Tax=Aegilops tauschii subsp. strangulata TaxID=200361 RepID=A0A453DVW9_AEGTS
KETLAAVVFLFVVLEAIFWSVGSYGAAHRCREAEGPRRLSQAGLGGLPSSGSLPIPPTAISVL